ncbi:MAG: secretin N-terminal domain-containing protein [Methylotenera sp.]
MDKLAAILMPGQKYIVAMLCLCFSLHATAAPEFKIITLQHRFAEEILPIIKPLVGNEGTATAMQNNLIIRTDSRNMAEIEQIIARLDTARQNLKITVSRQDNRLSDKSSAEVSGRKRIGNVAVGTGSYPNNANDGVQIDIENRQSKTGNSSNQFIQVMDGERAFILVGQSIPYTQEWVSLTHRYVSVQRTTEFIEINTGFAIRPRSIGNQIELEITPRFTQLNQNGFLDFEVLTTVIRANRGEWVDLGGIMQQKDDVSRAILNWQASHQSLNNKLLIRVE